MDRKKYLEDIKWLNEQTELYDAGESQVTDISWDEVYFSVSEYEKKTGFIAKDSPTNKIYFSLENKLNKVEHKIPMLSMQKTKNLDEILNWMGNECVVILPKLDGLSCAITYRDGKLFRAETRGNGKVGEDITHNARVLRSIPSEINIKDEVIILGEIICKLDDFEEFSSTYKNPRNFASGSIRLLDSSECAKRKLTFVAYDSNRVHNGYTEKLLEIYGTFGFEIPTFFICFDKSYSKYGEELEDNVNKIKELSIKYNYPIDGVVFRIENEECFNLLGKTDHHYNGNFAYKFYDDEYFTNLIDITWQVGKTGSLTPVANFEPVEIDGAIVKNASLHNLSILIETLGNPYIGQPIKVYKANMIIPQIVKNPVEYKKDKKAIMIPTKCPICGEHLIKEGRQESINLKCVNKDCKDKKIRKLLHFINTFEIDSLSNKTVSKLYELGFLKSFKDIFELFNYKERLLEIDGFGEKSLNEIFNNIEKSKEVELWQVISAIGINGVEKKTSQKIAERFKTFDNFISQVKNKSSNEFLGINSIGLLTIDKIMFHDYLEICEVIKYLDIKEVDSKESLKFSRKTFCITGKLDNYKNRDELIKLIEENGGVISSVNSNLSYLISNDKDSTSNKMNKAKELGVAIISEKEFSELLNGE